MMCARVSVLSASGGAIDQMAFLPPAPLFVREKAEACYFHQLRGRFGPTQLLIRVTKFPGDVSSGIRSKTFTLQNYYDVYK